MLHLQLHVYFVRALNLSVEEKHTEASIEVYTKADTRAKSKYTDPDAAVERGRLPKVPMKPQELA